MSVLKSAVLAVMFVSGFSTPIAQCGSIYRCLAPGGKVSFQSTRCAHEGNEIAVQPVMSGWTGLRTGELNLLQSYREKEVRLRARSRSAKPQPKVVETGACWNKRRRLEAVRVKLRRGYKAVSGESLRRKRDDYEAYLARFCP